MEKHFIKEKTWNAIQLVNAIKQHDDASIMRLIGSLAEPELATETVRQNTTNVVTEIRLTRNFKHSCLWVAPVIIKHGAVAVLPDETGGVVSIKSPQLMGALRGMFAEHDEVRHLGGLLPYSTLTHLTPATTYQTCKVFSGMLPGAALQFQDEGFDGALELPRLTFLLGAFSGINHAPEIRDSTTLERDRVRQMLSGLVQFKLGRESSVTNNVTALEPMEFGHGLYQGVRRWLEVIGREYTFHSVSVKLERGDRYGFKLYLQKSPLHEVQSLEWAMKSTQIPEGKIAELYHWLDECCALPQSMREMRKDFLH